MISPLKARFCDFFTVATETDFFEWSYMTIAFKPHILFLWRIFLRLGSSSSCCVIELQHTKNINLTHYTSFIGSLWHSLSLWQKPALETLSWILWLPLPVDVLTIFMRKSQRLTGYWRRQQYIVCVSTTPEEACQASWMRKRFVFFLPSFSHEMESIFWVKFHPVPHCKKLPLDATLFCLEMETKYANLDWSAIYKLAICMFYILSPSPRFGEIEPQN